MSYQTYEINEYEDDMNVIDSGVVQLDNDDASTIIDLAIEIALRHNDGRNYDIVLDMLKEACKEMGVI